MHGRCHQCFNLPSTNKTGGGAEVTSNTGLEHFVQNPLQGIVLQSGRHPLLVAQLLVHLVVLAVAVLLAADDDAVVWGQGLLEPDSDAEADHGGQGAVRDGRRDLDEDGDDGVGRGDDACARGGGDVDVLEIDDRELAEGDGVLWVGDGGDQVYKVLAEGVLALWVLSSSILSSSFCM